MCNEGETYLVRVCDKIRATGVALLECQRSIFRNTKLKIAKVRDKLGVLFKHLPSLDLIEHRGVLMHELDTLLG